MWLWGIIPMGFIAWCCVRRAWQPTPSLSPTSKEATVVTTTLPAVVVVVDTPPLPLSPATISPPSATTVPSSAEAEEEDWVLA